jgi:nitrate reductase NapE component
VTRARIALHHRVDHRSEDGTSLILALAMVTLISVALVAALGFSTASLRTVSVIGSQRTSVYSADAAVQTAIQAMRYNATAGTTAAGTACPSVDSAAVGLQPAVTVTCQVVVPRSTATMPAYSILSLGNLATESGIKLTATGTVKIAGPIASNSPAIAATNSVSAGILDLSGYSVDANGTCAGTITVTTPTDKRCSTGLSYADPGYPSRAIPSPLPTPNPPTICAAPNAVLQFQPGYYTNTAVLTPASYTVGGNTCTTGYLYFQPGVYYFDFGFNPAFVSTIWSVAANLKIVGGEPNGWDPNVSNSLPPVPGGGSAAACKTEVNGGTQGVQFIFGGASHMSAVAAGTTVELCADPSVSGQQIAIYGQMTGATPTPQTSTQVPNAAVPTPAGGWANLPTSVLPISPSTSTIDTQVASYTMPVGATDTIALDGYVGSNAFVPAGSINVTYSLKIAHQETTSVATNITSIKATIGACPAFTLTKHNTVAVSPPVTDTFAIPAGVCTTAVQTNPFSVSIVAIAAAGKSFVENLDGADLVVTYTPPVVRAENGCVLTDITNCSIIKVGTSTAKVYVWGTVYAPLASVNVSYVASGAFEFRRGVIARTVLNAGTPPADTTGGFCLGAGSPCIGPGRVLMFTATVSGGVRLRALVRYADVPLGNAAFIVSWNVIRG